MQSKFVGEESGTTSEQPSAIALAPIAASFCFLLELSFTPLCLPQIQDEFSLGRTEMGQVVSLFLFTSAVLIVPFGLLCRYFSLESLFLTGLLIFIAGCIEFILSSSQTSMMLARCVQGFGAAMFTPMIPVMLVAVNRKNGGFLLAVWASYSGVLSAIAPFVAGIVLAYGDWRAAQAVICLVALFAVVACITVWKSPTYSRKAQEKVKSGQQVVSRKNMVVLLYVFVTYAMTTFLIVHGAIELGERKWQSIQIGIVMTVMWSAFSFTSFAIRKSINESNVSMLLLMGALLDVGGLLLFLEHLHHVCVYLAFGLAGAGMALNNAPTTALLLDTDASTRHGILSSLDIAVARVGGSLSVLLLAPMHRAEVAGALVVMTVVASVCSIYWRSSRTASKAAGQ